MGRLRPVLIAVVLLGPPVQQCSARSGSLASSWRGPHRLAGAGEWGSDVGVWNGRVDKRVGIACDLHSSSALLDAMCPDNEALRGGGLAAMHSSSRIGEGKAGNGPAVGAVYSGETETASSKSPYSPRPRGRPRRIGPDGMRLHPSPQVLARPVHCP